MHRCLLSALLLLTAPLLLTALPALAHDEASLPAGVRELRRSVNGQRADVWLAVDDRFFGPSGLEETAIEDWQGGYLARIGSEDPAALPDSVRQVVLWARLPRRIANVPAQVGAWQPLPALMAPPLPVPRKASEGPPRLPGAPMASALVGRGMPGDVTGGLSGKTVYLSPGHGFTWTQALDRWATQRGNTHGLVEDLLNAEGALHYLVPMLHNAGAHVVTLRESDMNPQMAVLDDSIATGADGAGYLESGVFQKGTNPGFAPKASWLGTDNPFAGGGYRTVQATTGKATASASYVPAMAQTGVYAIYLGYTAGKNRVPDAHVEIHHLGGVSHVRVDQTRHGGTWVYLGQYALQQGVHPDTGAVILRNDTLSGLGDRYLIADVVRIGGGQGDVARGTGKPPAAGPTSGRARWEESCRTYAQFSGAPPTVYDWSSSDPSDDVSCRSRMAAWVHEDGEDAIYLSWHTNAPDPGRGTSTYVYGPNEPDGSYKFTGVKGSDAFGKLIQDTMVKDIRALWDPAWKDRGLLTAWFGEINPSHNPEMPSALVEAAFHSTKADADQLREPRFRHVLARSLYKAIAAYFAQRDKIPLLLLPEPPEALALVRTAPGQALLTWQPGASAGAYGQAPTGYLVQLSKDGVGFDEGTAVASTSLAIALPAGAVPVFARVVAVNGGGASLPSATVGAVEGCAGAPRALVVPGFTRLDSALAPVEDLSAYGLGKVQRLRQTRMNTFDYAVLHVQALAAAGMGVDAAERTALSPAKLDGHVLVDWAAGEQSVADGVLDAAQQKSLVTWLEAGPGRTLWLAGSEVAYALDAKAAPAGGDWLETWFGARYAADGAGTYAMAGAGALSGSWTFDDGSHHAYDVDSADVLQAKGGSPILQYAGGKGTAAVLHTLPGGARTVLMGVPLEAVWPADARLQLVAKLLQASVQPVVCAGEPSGADAGSTDASAAPDAGGDAPPAEVSPPADTAAVDVGEDQTGDQLGDQTSAGPEVTDAQGLAGGDAIADAKAQAAQSAAAASGCTAATGAGSGTWALLALLAGAAWLLRRRRAEAGPGRSARAG